MVRSRRVTRDTQSRSGGAGLPEEGVAIEFPTAGDGSEGRGYAADLGGGWAVLQTARHAGIQGVGVEVREPANGGLFPITPPCPGIRGQTAGLPHSFVRR